MHPAFSVIFLTTLIGAGQGLFLALFLVESLSIVDVLPQQAGSFYANGSVISLFLLVAGLFASFFHLGRPERAWRSATMWRTSWLSREVIMLPAFMFVVFLYAINHYMVGDVSSAPVNGEVQNTVLLGITGVILCFALYICTGMIYACLKFLQEWHTPLTPINYALLGVMSGFTLAAVYASVASPALAKFYAGWALIITIAAFVFRFASLERNKRLKPKSTLQTALGVRHNKITQKARGAMGGSFNTREFFHGKPPEFFKVLKWFFLVAAFAIPFLILLVSSSSESFILFFIAFLIQYAGLVAERWFFFAQSNHPQNLYYQSIS
jgi:DMSO reductase anchor subunit